MIFRIGVVICALGVIAAATHANVQHAGGYSSESAPLVITIAALVTFGMGYVGVLWSERRRLAAVALFLLFLCGEAYWLFTNTDRELSLRDAEAAPFAAAVAAKAAAKERVTNAEGAKTNADAAIVSEAAKPGCKTDCAKLLADAQAAAAAELTDARKAFEALPEPRSMASLAAHLNVPLWAWDLLMAGLRSAATMGASIALGAALHRQRVQERTEGIVAEPRAIARQTRPTKLVAALPPPKDENRENVSRFLKQVGLRPDPEGEVSLKGLQRRYLDLCETPLPPAEFGKQMRSIIDAIGLECVPVQGDMIIRGATVH
jgi:hypothetical protein